MTIFEAHGKTLLTQPWHIPLLCPRTAWCKSSTCCFPPFPLACLLILDPRPPKTEADLVPILSQAANGVFQSVASSQANFLEDTIRSHSKENQTMLSNMVSDGGMLKLAANDQSGWDEVQQVVEQMYYGRMMPLAWELSPEKQRPFIL